MEHCLEEAKGPSGLVWKRFKHILQRTDSLEEDIKMLEGLIGCETGLKVVPSPAAAAYATRLREASQLEASGTPLLLGHFYTRYLADLFGGSMLGWPTKLALSLPEVPRFYVHDEIRDRRRETVEAIYEALNEAELTPAQTKAVVDEATLAFRLNAALYREGVGGGGIGMFAGAALGGLRVAVGHANHRISGGTRSVFG